MPILPTIQLFDTSIVGLPVTKSLVNYCLRCSVGRHWSARHVIEATQEDLVARAIERVPQPYCGILVLTQLYAGAIRKICNTLSNDLLQTPR